MYRGLHRARRGDGPPTSGIGGWAEPPSEYFLVDALLHEDVWPDTKPDLIRLVKEDVQTKSVDKSLLTQDELKVYESLLAHRWGASKRLEQERLEWPTSLAAVLAALHQRESQPS